MADVILKSGEHYALIEADSPLVHLIADRMYTSGFLTNATPNVKKYLKKYGYETTDGLGFNSNIKCREAVLKGGEEFAVAGRARWISTSGLKFHIPAKRVLLISETKESGVVFSDDTELVKKEFFKTKAQKK